MITPPDFLMPYLEKELDNCWIFYKKGEDFTAEQYAEISKITRGFLRTPHTGVRYEWIGVQIKLYKEWNDIVTPAY